MKIENRQFQEKIEERNRELLQLKVTAGNTLQVLNRKKVMYEVKLVEVWWIFVSKWNPSRQEKIPLSIKLKLGNGTMDFPFLFSVTRPDFLYIRISQVSFILSPTCPLFFSSTTLQRPLFFSTMTLQRPLFYHWHALFHITMITEETSHIDAGVWSTRIGNKTTTRTLGENRGGGNHCCQGKKKKSELLFLDLPLGNLMSAPPWFLVDLLILFV